MVPVSSLSSNVLPAGTVNPLMFTVVHLTAAETSSSEEMVPVQSVAEGAATMNGTKARRAARRRKLDMITGDECRETETGREPGRLASTGLGFRLYIRRNTRECRRNSR